MFKDIANLPRFLVFLGLIVFSMIMTLTPWAMGLCIIPFLVGYYILFIGVDGWGFIGNVLTGAVLFLLSWFCSTVEFNDELWVLWWVVGWLTLNIGSSLFVLGFKDVVKK